MKNILYILLLCSQIAIAQVDFLANSEIPKAGTTPSNYLVWNSNLYYGANYNFLRLVDSPFCAMMKSDGTSGGTNVLKRLSYSYEYTAISATKFAFTTADLLSDNVSLWVSDGTAAGTQVIKSVSVYNNDLTFLTACNGKLFFSEANLGNSNLWVTDGTIAGTTQIATGLEFDYYSKFFSYNNKLYFSAKNLAPLNTDGAELWSSDGTVAGTAMLKNICTTANCGSEPRNFCIYNTKLYFSAKDATNGRELWVTDGTAANTVMLKDIATGLLNSEPLEMAVFNSKMFFSAMNNAGDRELYSTDGTAANTVLFKDLNATNSSTPAYFTVYNGNMYFTAFSSVSGYQLYKSDGTVANTGLFKNVQAVTGSGGMASGDYIHGQNDFSPFGVANNLLFFIAYDGINGTTGRELWKTDGTLANTQVVTDIMPGKTSAFDEDVAKFGVINNKLVFTAKDPILGNTTFLTDGTTTSVLKNTNPVSKYIDGLVSQKIYPFPLDVGANTPGSINVAGVDPTQIYYAGTSLSGGVEPWVTDGTPAGTFRLKDIFTGVNSSDPNNFIYFGGKTYFAATSVATPLSRSLWVTDGTSIGTTQVDNFANLNPQNITIYNSKLYFKGTGGLYSSDGTTAGTTLILSSSQIGDTPPFVYNGELYFENNYGQLWKVTGSTAALVKSIQTSSSSVAIYIYGFTIYNGTLYFGAKDNTHGYELWKTDGTAAGTTMVSDLNTGANDSNPYSLTVYNGNLYFGADDGAVVGGIFGVYTLFKFDGTTIQKVKQINPTNDALPYGFTVYNSKLYFFANDGTHGLELWQSDGTSLGTTMVQDIYPGTLGSCPFGMTVFNNKLYFFASDPSSGYEPRVLDLLNSITLVEDIQPGAENSLSFPFVPMNGNLHFWATNTTNGCSLYRIANLPETITTGNWNANGTWSTNSPPVATQKAKINSTHTVNIPNAGNQVKTIIMNGGNINLTGGTLEIKNQ
jgi:trimeric autotransporter adhesin